MLMINRVLGTTLAAGALLLVGLTPASAQAATRQQSAPATAKDFYATGWAFYSQARALNNALTTGYGAANAAGYPTSECTTIHQWLWPTVAAGQPVRWNAEVEIECTAPAAAGTTGHLS
ncbi:hypothetical protein [Kitasatospora kifunensis]|uniref:Uncharacterized protein n=1 Tax=Kitasatospora kifunensis TaxID=58351 RepID=A0A7W7W0Q6_KITKI|nr:hypothetical protein [Kitasatospora kifunensis]MBB4928964.1 hypothetical protein [Kitasatospora kifunensis]